MIQNGSQILAADTLFDRIRQYYLSGKELSSEDDEIRKRWAAAFAFLLEDKGSDRECCIRHMRQFGVSEAQAYRDIRHAKLLFGDVRRSEKEALRYMVTQWAIELYRMAQLRKDFKGMEKALERITKANNLDKEDQDLPDPSKVQPPVQLLQLSFNFIRSEYFHLIDEKAREEILRVVAQVEELISRSTVKEYLDIYQPVEPVAAQISDGNH